MPAVGLPLLALLAGPPRVTGALWQQSFFSGAPALGALALVTAVLGVALVRARRTNGRLARALAARAAELEREVERRTAALGGDVERGVADLALLGAVLEAAPCLVATLDGDRRVRWLNAAGRRLLGVDADADLDARALADLVPRATFEQLVTEAIPTALDAGTWSGAATLGDRAGGGERPVALTIVAPRGAGAAAGAARELTLLALDLGEAHQLRAELRQARRMEAVGRLAGGVAHDFNNLLTVIIGTAELVASELLPGSRSREDVAAIRRAADRAATLTRHLVAYSRRQMPQPQVLALDDALRNMDTMLRRLVGDRIALDLTLAGGEVRADLAQLEQVVAHLAQNARDAMPEGGTLTLATATVDLHHAMTHGHGLVPPGRYVALTVRDTGCGMEAATLARCFEPFFTTKPEGDHTGGVGLATVYGIVKQGGGYIWCESAPGAGATFTIYFRRHLADPLAPATGTAARERRADDAAMATILLVEDEELVRAVAAKTLRKRGFTVLEAASGPDALRLAGAYPDPIHLLLTDVVMPQMSGAELAAELLRSRPTLRVLYASGAASNAPVAGGPGHGAGAAAFLQKPFTAQALEERVREVLRRP